MLVNQCQTQQCSCGAILNQKQYSICSQCHHDLLQQQLASSQAEFKSLSSLKDLDIAALYQEASSRVQNGLISSLEAQLKELEAACAELEQKNEINLSIIYKLEKERFNDLNKMNLDAYSTEEHLKRETERNMKLTEQYEMLRQASVARSFFKIELKKASETCLLNGRPLVFSELEAILPVIQYIMLSSSQGNHHFISFIDVEERVIVVLEQTKGEKKRQKELLIDNNVSNWLPYVLKQLETIAKQHDIETQSHAFDLQEAKVNKHLLTFKIGSDLASLLKKIDQSEL